LGKKNVVFRKVKFFHEEVERSRFRIAFFSIVSVSYVSSILFTAGVVFVKGNMFVA